MVEWLLAHSKVDISQTDKVGHNAFGMAVKQSNFDIAALLIKATPNFNIDQRSVQGYTLLHEAAADGNLATVKFLVEHGANMTLFGPCGQTAAGWCEERFDDTIGHGFPPSH